jgi:hypothetical protein
MLIEEMEEEDLACRVKVHGGSKFKKPNLERERHWS